jgi:hypothetical protein
MGAGDADGSVTARYAELAEEALAEAERLREHWKQVGDADGAKLAGRLAGLLANARDDARRGRLPPRTGGFPLTRFMSDYEWGEEGRRVEDLAYAMQRCWRESG